MQRERPMHRERLRLGEQEDMTRTGNERIQASAKPAAAL
jgi:hypothetical protein